MDEEPSLERGEILALASEIVVAYAGNNAIETSMLTELIGGVFAKLSALATDEQAVPEALVPAVPIRRSVTDDYIICLEDGKMLKMLKRHLMTSYGLTPDAYRAQWGSSRTIRWSLRATRPNARTWPGPSASAASRRSRNQRRRPSSRAPAGRAPAPEPDAGPTGSRPGALAVVRLRRDA